jgi:hypothetical protein
MEGLSCYQTSVDTTKNTLAWVEVDYNLCWWQGGLGLPLGNYNQNLATYQAKAVNNPLQQGAITDHL